MKSYQDPDPLHGNGKAMPHPKQPTRYSYRGAAFGSPVHVNRNEMQDTKKAATAEKATAGRQNLTTVVAILAACLGFNRGR